jgi:predicted DNA repair protein MutK
MIVSCLALLITVGVYGPVAAIVKLDDLGLCRLRKPVSGSYNKIQRLLGRPLLIFAPKMIKLLPIVATIAMLLVADEILTHSFALRGFIINQCRRSSC